MVCPRYIVAVSNILKELDIPYISIQLGVVELVSLLDLKKKLSLSIQLQDAGFSLINNRKSQLIEQMKSMVVERIHHSDDGLDIKWPDVISDRLNLDFKYLSSLFTSVQNITFEQYVITQKIERVKELIAYDELSLSEIAFKLNYSSVAYLSNQFKEVTGMTPTQV